MHQSTQTNTVLALSTRQGRIDAMICVFVDDLDLLHPNLRLRYAPLLGVSDQTSVHQHA